MKIVIIGSSGQLGTFLMKAFSDMNPIGITHSQLEISDAESVERMVEAYRPDWIISTASYHRVDEVEHQPDRAAEVNGIGYLNLARASYVHNTGLVVYGTDYIFGGEKREPYLETDRPNPLSVYGITRLLGEHFVARYSARYMIIRVSGLFGGEGRAQAGGNFVKRIIDKARKKETLRIVTDQVLSQTHCDEVAVRTRQLVEIGISGIYHLVSEGGGASWYDFAKRTFEIAKITADLVPITSEELKAPARRPAYSVLANTRARALGVPKLPHWNDSLERYVKTLEKNQWT